MNIGDSTGLPVVSLTRSLDAAPERVWRALTDDKELTEWYWPQSLHPSIDVDLRVDGAYRIAASAPEMAVSGRYIEVAEPSHLVTSWQWDGEDAVSTVTFDLASDSPNRTELTVTHSGLAPDEVESHRQGWSDCLNRMPSFLG
jgi:uncharacterized protein YndB with AHSA1/START domain